MQPESRLFPSSCGWAARSIATASIRPRDCAANDPMLGDFIAGALRKKLASPPKELTIWNAGPTVGANAGPGAAGMFFHEE